MRSLDEATRVFASCDAAWQHELAQRFGEAATAARYFAAGKGAEGSRLRSRWQAREDARKDYSEAWNASRNCEAVDPTC